MSNESEVGIWISNERQIVVEFEFGGSGWHQTWMSNECELNV